MGRFFQRDTWQGDHNKPLSLNPYMYTEGNPINFIDPSGHRTCSGDVCQDYPPVSAPYDSTQYVEISPLIRINKYLEFEPKNSFLPALGIPVGEFEAQYKADPDSSCGSNSCGSVVIAAILRNLRDSSPTAQEVFEALDNCGPISFDTTETLAKQFGLSVVHKQSWVKSKDYKLSQFQIIRDHLRSGEWPVTQVGINSSTGDIMQVTETGDNRHFIVITGLSSEQYWTDSTQSEKRWVRIFDPFENQTEYHTLDNIFYFVSDKILFLK